MAIYNDDEVKGKWEKAEGTVKGKAGEITGNNELESEGEAERSGGESREAWGKLKHGAADTVDAIGDAVSNAGKKIND